MLFSVIIAWLALGCYNFRLWLQLPPMSWNQNATKWAVWHNRYGGAKTISSRKCRPDESGR